MRRSQLSPTLSIRTTLVFIALVVSAIALGILGTKPAESQQAPSQPLYSVQDLGTLAEGTFSVATDINDANQVVGSSTISGDCCVGHAFLYSGGQMSDLGTLAGSTSPDANSTARSINTAGKVVGGSTHAFLYSGGQMQDLGTLNEADSFGYSEAYGINDADQVVGESSTNGNVCCHAFLFSNGAMTDLGTLGGSYSIASSINDAGHVAGFSYNSGDETGEAFLYSGERMNGLGTLGGSFSGATDINDADQVVGDSLTTGDAERRAFLYSGGQMNDLGTLGAPPSTAFGINDAGEVVGMSGTSSGDFGDHAFLYSNGVMKDLNDLIPERSGWKLERATAINNDGYIVGQGINDDGQTHAFMLTPYFDGFYQPVDNPPTLNKTKPGKTIPIRFSLGGDKGLNIFADGYPKSEAIPCDSTATVDGIEESVTGKGGLSYNASTDTYEYAWATSSTSSGCRQFVMKLKDGTVHRANFIFR